MSRFVAMLRLVFAAFSVVCTVLAVDPIVSITEPFDISGLKEIIVHKNSDTAMVCVVENKRPDIQVKWKREIGNKVIEIGTDTSSSDPQKYTIIKMTPTSWRLTLQNIQVSDDGRYICEVQIATKVYKSDYRDLRTVEPPQIVDMLTSSDTITPEGDKLTFVCSAAGRPDPRIKWTRMAEADLPNGGQELWNNVLPITEVRPVHRGKYICSALNEAGEDKRVINLMVQFRPHVRAETPSISQAIGYRKELLCTIEAYPEPSESQVIWTRKGAPISGDNYKTMYMQGAINKVTTKLTIVSVGDTDFGDYICKATNSQGTSHAKISLIQSDSPTSDRSGQIHSHAYFLSVSITTLIMLLSVCLIHQLENN